MRLNKIMRHQITNKVVEATFQAAEAVQREDGKLLALRARNEVLTKEEIATMAKLPVKFFGSGSYSFYAKPDIEGTGEYTQLCGDNDMALPVFMRNMTHIVSALLWADIKTHGEAVNALAAEKHKFTAQTRGVIDAFSDVDKLLRAWPTLRDVMGKDYFANVTPANLPMVQVNTLDVQLRAALKIAA